MIYVLAFPRFSADLAASLDRFRAIHEPERARLVRPHITLVFGLARVPYRTQFIDDCEAVLTGTGVIEIGFGRCARVFDAQEDVHKLLLLCDHGREAITAIHDALCDSLKIRSRVSTGAYRPHMTIATNTDPSALAGMAPLSVIGAPMRGVVDRVGIMSLANGRLQNLKTIALTA